MVAYAKVIKAVDPTVEVLGPEEWGWDGYFYSGADQQQFAAGASNGFDVPCNDRAAHGVYVEYLLAQIHDYELAHPLEPRLLDCTRCTSTRRAGSMTSPPTSARPCSSSATARRAGCGTRIT